MKHLVIIHTEKAKFVFREVFIPLLKEDMNLISSKEKLRCKIMYK